MNKKFKKILTTTLVSAATIAAVGCGSPNTKLAKNIDKGMADFVSSINNLDYVDTSITETTSDNKIGKIVETAANALDDKYLTKTLEELNIDNSITIPSERNDNFKLYILSSSPFISFTSDDNTASLSMQFNFSTNKIEKTSNKINEKINNLILKRSILMIYVNEIYNNRVELTEENRVAINAYVNVIKENASFLNGNRGMVKNQLTLANDLANNNSNDNLINYYIIKSGEALETRSNKIDSTISAIDAIIDIIESNLTPSSIYYSSSLSTTYENLISNINSTNNTSTTIDNKELADNISNSLKFTNINSENTNSATLPEFRLGDQNINSNSVNQNTMSQVNTTSRTNQNKKTAATNIESKTTTHNSQNTIKNQTRTLQNNNLEITRNNKSESNTDIANKSTNSKTLEMRKNKKSAKNHQNNNKSSENLTNNEYFTNNNITITPKTLELPQINSDNQIHNESEYKTNSTEQSRAKSRQSQANQKTVQENSMNNSYYQRRDTANNHRAQTHENIKRVPYVKNFD